MFAAMSAGFFVSLSLIMAIGAQNALVLRQGLRREHVGTVVAICAVSDAILIAVGVAGFGAVAEAVPWLGTVMRLGGAAFLFVYGAMRFRAAWQGGEALVPTAAPATSRRQVAMTCLLLTWANPHVYLDTLMLIGSISTRHAPNETAFGIGAVAASLAFFTALGHGARGLAPLLRRPVAWVVLEVAMGLLMWALAAGLVWNA